MKEQEITIVPATVETISVDPTEICVTDTDNAYLLLSKNHIGLTKNINNIAGAIQNLPDEEFFICKATPGKLKKEAEALLLTDSIVDNIDNPNKIVVQEVKYGIFQRPFPKKLISPISRIE